MSALLFIQLFLPFIALSAAFLAGPQRSRAIVTTFLAVGVGVAAAIVASVGKAREPLVEFAGGWAPPLGIALRADGISSIMLAVTAITALGIALAAPRTDADSSSATTTSPSFWILLPGVCGALNAMFLAGDLFTLYVALELLAFAAVPLVCLNGTGKTLRAALRYLIFALVGSALYLLGAVLLYGNYGTLDLALLAKQIQPGLPVGLAISLMTAGLAAKTALFPLHIWLPPAHAGAPPPASALLSGLVIKGSFFLTVRIWFDLLGGPAFAPGAQILGVMGAAGILAGSVLAIRQNRLKSLIAYSTVAQIGYLFLIFPLAAGSSALAAGIFQAGSHALAKASMFLAAGIMAESLAGTDRLSELRGAARTVPFTFLAFLIAGASLVGVPPSGGFITKWLLFQACAETLEWWWAVVIIAGGLLAGGYLFRAASSAWGPPPDHVQPQPIASHRQAVVMALALGAWLLGVMAPAVLQWIPIGRAVAGEPPP